MTPNWQPICVLLRNGAKAVIDISVLNVELFIAPADSAQLGLRCWTAIWAHLCLFRCVSIFVPRAFLYSIEYIEISLRSKNDPCLSSVCMWFSVRLVSWLCSGLGHVNVIIAGVQTTGLASQWHCWVSPYAYVASSWLAAARAHRNSRCVWLCGCAHVYAGKTK